MSRYFAPTTAAGAAALLGEYEGARVVAGGTDLVVAARGGKHPMPEVLIAIHGATDLASQAESEDGLRLGALTSHAWIERSPLIGSNWSALADASALVGSPATRNSGTLGGNLMNASPAMDTGAPLLVFEAGVELLSLRGTRTVPVADLLAGPGRTTAEPDELLTSVRLPDLPPATGSAYVRLEHRRAMEIAVVGAAALVTLGDDGRVADSRIALSAAAPTCVRARKAENLLRGLQPDGASFRDAAALATEAVQPITDVRASARYRRAMISVVVSRALAAAAARAAGTDIAVPANRNLPTVTAGSTG
ncbi:FAD binding domain-containing protein [Streptomyces sp. NPDC046197]|uniref:FAD binding domain-containing protein n=1 Tax=Streptomyces sp. NPDC046197 TaxID=3154337 RepID=UPI0033F17C53